MTLRGPTIKITRILANLLLAVAGQAGAVVVAADQLNIGSSNTLTSSTANGVVGTYNTLQRSNTFVVGSYNYMLGNAGSSMAVGAYNQVGAPGSVAIGYNNYFPEDDFFGNAENSLIVGQSNLSLGVASLVVGSNSGIEMRPGTDGYSLYLPQASVALGIGVYNRFDHSLAIGKFNETFEPMPENVPMPLFLIGNGTSTSTRSNAFEVWEDGRIKMVRQGDILMGEFGSP